MILKISNGPHDRRLISAVSDFFFRWHLIQIKPYEIAGFLTTMSSASESYLLPIELNQISKSYTVFARFMAEVRKIRFLLGFARSVVLLQHESRVKPIETGKQFHPDHQIALHIPIKRIFYGFSETYPAAHYPELSLKETCVPDYEANLPSSVMHSARNHIHRCNRANLRKELEDAVREKRIPFYQFK